MRKYPFEKDDEPLDFFSRISTDQQQHLILLAAGVDVNTRNNYVQTALSVSNDQIRKILLEAGTIE